jgi:hypothetical protein
MIEAKNLDAARALALRWRAAHLLRRLFNTARPHSVQVLLDHARQLSPRSMSGRLRLAAVKGPRDLVPVTTGWSSTGVSALLLGNCFAEAGTWIA